MRWFLLAILASGCAFSQKVTVEFDRGVDFSRIHTFALVNGKVNSRNPALNNELVQKKLDDAVVRYLSAKGLTEVMNHGDVNVRYTLGSARKKEVERYPVGRRGARRVRISFTEGTLVIDLHDPADHNLLWRSIAREDKGDAEKLVGKLDEMVKKSIAKYPPKPGRVR